MTGKAIAAGHRRHPRRHGLLRRRTRHRRRRHRPGRLHPSPKPAHPPPPIRRRAARRRSRPSAGWDAGADQQRRHDRQVGAQLDVPARGWVIAVATAMQESIPAQLRQPRHANDHDSLGLFQQRPSQGWGTPAQIMNPVYAATQFYQPPPRRVRTGRTCR